MKTWALRLRTAFSDAIYLVVGYFASWTLWSVPGLPLTHDGMGIQVIECFRRAYVAHDFFPRWFSFLSNGYGSGLPMLYHRLHGQVFGVLALAVGTLAATKLSVPICLAIGGAGMRRFAREHHVRPWLAWVCGALLMTTNYAFSDWFVRGAVAELLGFMLVPWCLLALVRVLRGTSSFVALALALTLLFYAHMLAFYFSMFFILSATVAHVARHWRYGWRALRPPLSALALAGGILCLTLGPYIAAMQFAAHMASVTDIKMRPDAIAYIKVSEYFFDSNHDWDHVRNTGKVSVEIGRWVLVGTLLFGVASAQARAAIKRHAWLWLPAIVFLALQPQEMSFVFEKIPGAAKIQFPLRLLVYIVPVAVFCFGVVAEHALRSGRLPLRVGVALLAVVAVLMQLNMNIDAQRDSETTAYTPELVATALASNDPSATKLSAYDGGWDFFVPGRFHRPVTPHPFLSATGNCSLTSPELLGTSQSSSVLYTTQFHSFTFVVHGQDCTVTLAQFHTPLLEFDVAAGHVTADGDQTVFQLPSDGTLVRVRQRPLLDMSFRWLNEAFHLSTLPKVEP